MTTKKDLQEIQNDYRKFADYLLTRLEESQKRYMAAERILFTLLPWYGRIFAKKKILRVLREHALYDTPIKKIYNELQEKYEYNRETFKNHN